MNKTKQTKIITAAFVFALSAIICVGLYKFSTAHDVRKSGGLLKDTGCSTEPGPVDASSGSTASFSFLCDVKLHPKAVNRLHTLLVNHEFGLGMILEGKRDIQVYKSIKTGKENVCFPSPNGKNVLRFFPSSFKGRTWNQVGMVYHKGTVSTYVNGKLLWEAAVAGEKEKMPLNGFLLAPGKTDTAIPFNGWLRSALFFNRVLSRQEIKEHYRSTFIQEKRMGSPVFILFLIFVILCSIMLYMVYIVRRMLKLTDEKPNGGTHPAVVRLSLLTVANLLLFVVFNLGYPAAKYFSGISQYPGPGIYWFILNICFFAILFTMLMEKLTGAPLKHCIVLSTVILLFPLLVCFLAQLPRFGDIYPVIFNIAMAAGFSLVPGSYDLLRLHTLEFAQRQTADEPKA